MRLGVKRAEQINCEAKWRGGRGSLKGSTERITRWGGGERERES